MGGIFINYRRGDHDDVVLLLGRLLSDYFDPEQIFLDILSIRLGTRFPKVLPERVLDSEVVLVIIHPQWLTSCNTDGSRRIDDEHDWVRRELVLALQARKKIIPILLDNTSMPAREELPKSIQPLVEWQAYRIRTDSRDGDIETLISQVKRLVAPIWESSDAIENTSSQPPGRWLAVLTGALTVLLLVAPSALVLNAASPVAGELPVAFYLAGWSLLLMCAPFLTAAAVWGTQLIINSAERELHSLPTNRYNRRVAVPLAVTVLAAPLAVAVSLGSGLGVLISVLIACVGVVYVSTRQSQTERIEAELQRNWSYRLPSRVHPALLRQGVTLLDQRMQGWSRPVSAEQSEKAASMLDALDNGANRLCGATGQGRRHWLAERPWWTAAYILWLAVTVGLAAATAVSLLQAGQTPGRTLLLPVFALLIGGVLAWGTMDVVYRRHRRRNDAVAAEVAENVRKLRRELDVLVAPRLARGSSGI
ncbi:MAG: TIR domain-containing protein [Pseudonocardia sp.]